MEEERKTRRGGPKREYRVEVRGEIPGNLKEKISALHALCILQGKKKTLGKKKGN